MTALFRTKYLIYALPVVGLLIWIGILEYDFRHARRIEVPIVGYDPRDLISGHYVEFRLDLGDQNPCKAVEQSPDQSELCLCWQPGDVAALAWALPCKSRSDSCEVLMRGTCSKQQFVGGIERFYIPENDTPYLQQLPSQSTLVVRVTKDGRSFADELKPARTPYKKWISKMKSSGSNK